MCSDGHLSQRELLVGSECSSTWRSFEGGALGSLAPSLCSAAGECVLCSSGGGWPLRAECTRGSGGGGGRCVAVCLEDAFALWALVVVRGWNSFECNDRDEVKSLIAQLDDATPFFSAYLACELPGA